MSSPFGIKAVSAVVLLSLMLGACSEIYYGRRETVSPDAGDAIAVNRVTQMIDPWPRYSASRNFAFNGERVQAAHERYRRGRVIPPVNVTTSSAAYQKAQESAAAAAAAVGQATSAAPAAPVKGP